jgi:hypothetical protein
MALTTVPSNMIDLIEVTKGGTGQTTAVASFDALSPDTTKGELIVNDGTNSVALAVGTNGQILAADSAELTGLKWIAPPVSGANAELSNLGTTALNADINMGLHKINGIGELNSSANLTVLSLTADGLTVDIANNWFNVPNTLTGGQQVIITGVDLPAPLVSGNTYWIQKGLGNPNRIGILTVAFTPPRIDLTTTGSGTVTFSSVVDTGISVTSAINMPTKRLTAEGLWADWIGRTAQGAFILDVLNQRISDSGGILSFDWGGTTTFIGKPLDLNANPVHNMASGTLSSDGATLGDISANSANKSLSNLVAPSINTDFNFNSHKINSVSEINTNNIGAAALEFASADRTDTVNGWFYPIGALIPPITENQPLVITGVDLPAPLVSGTTYYAAMGLGASTLGSGTVFINLLTVGTLNIPSNVDLFSNYLKNVLDPVNPQDAATKNYVDSLKTYVDTVSLVTSTNPEFAPAGNNQWHTQTANFVSLTAGVWELNGRFTWLIAGVNSFTTIEAAFAGDNGDDTGTVPTTIQSVTTVLSDFIPAYVQLARKPHATETIVMSEVPRLVVRVTGGPINVFLNTKTVSTDYTQVLITSSISARRIGL